MVFELVPIANTEFIISGYKSLSCYRCYYLLWKLIEASVVIYKKRSSKALVGIVVVYPTAPDPCCAVSEIIKQLPC